MSLLDRVVSLRFPPCPSRSSATSPSATSPGSAIDDAFACVRDLAAQGAMATIDILGEFIRRPEEAEENTEAYLESAAADPRRAAGRDQRLGQADRPGPAARRAALPGQHAPDPGPRARDATTSSASTWRTRPARRATIEIYRDAAAPSIRADVGLVLQSRLRRTLDDVDELAAAPANYRLCKGIYLEPRQIAYTDPELIRRNFVLVLDRMFEHGCLRRDRHARRAAGLGGAAPDPRALGLPRAVRVPDAARRGRGAAPHPDRRAATACGSTCPTASTGTPTRSAGCGRTPRSPATPSRRCSGARSLTTGRG